MMLRAPLLVLLAVLIAVPSLAQPRHSKTTQADNDVEQCVDVEIGGKRAGYNCLNQRFRRQVDRHVANPYAGRRTAPFDAGSQPHKIGVAVPSRMPAPRR